MEEEAIESEEVAGDEQMPPDVVEEEIEDATVQQVADKKGVALDIGLDEGSLKERKLKKFEDLKRRKLEEMERRRLEGAANRDKSQEPRQPTKSPIRGDNSRSPFRKEGALPKRVIRRGSEQRDDSEEEKMVQVSQSKLENLKAQPSLAAHVPPHILRKQQQRKEDGTPL